MSDFKRLSNSTVRITPSSNGTASSVAISP